MEKLWPAAIWIEDYFAISIEISVQWSGKFDRGVSFTFISLFYWLKYSPSSSTDESSIFNNDTVPKCELKTEIYACVIEQQQ